MSTSTAKTFAAEALFRVVDRAGQLCGGLGVSRDLPIAKIAREFRPFRIYDGPSEVHRWSIARRAVRAVTGRRQFHPESWPLSLSFSERQASRSPARWRRR
jgi:alkylation response protein AidB-like acyl-CoA dehydrogenase